MLLEAFTVSLSSANTCYRKILMLAEAFLINIFNKVEKLSCLCMHECEILNIFIDYMGRVRK